MKRIKVDEIWNQLSEGFLEGNSKRLTEDQWVVMSGDTFCSIKKVNNFQSCSEIKKGYPGRLGHHLIGVFQKL